MLRPANLKRIYDNFPRTVADTGSLKTLDFPDPDSDALTVVLLKEAVRYWIATLLQLLAARRLYKAWLHTWGHITIYYAEFFAINAVMRLSGRALTRSQSKFYRITRESNITRVYQVVEVNRADHKTQWNLYYRLIQGDVTDDPLMRRVFEIQQRQDFRHLEREFRQELNYNLEYGFDEIHNSAEALKAIVQTGTSMLPFEDPISALNDDYSYQIAEIIIIYRHIKYLLGHIAENENFDEYWQIQISKLRQFVSKAPFDREIKNWVLAELRLPS